MCLVNYIYKVSVIQTSVQLQSSSKLVTKVTWVSQLDTGLPNQQTPVCQARHASSALTLNTGIPQGCVLSPFLHSFFASNCTAVHASNTAVKFADHTTVMASSTTTEEVQQLAKWCINSNLALNTKTIVDSLWSSGRKVAHISPSNGTEVECVATFKFLGIHISEDLPWTLDNSTLVKKAHQCLLFLRQKKSHLPPQILVNFYRCTIESILSNCILM